MHLRPWLPLLLGFVLLVTGVSACAPAAQTVAGTERVTEHVVSGTERYIKKHGSISDEPHKIVPDDPLYWQMWQDSQGGG